MDLEGLRKKIDEIDARIVELMNRRAEIVVEIGGLKRSANETVYMPDREEAIYDHVAGLNEGPLSGQCLRAVYRELMSGCIALQKPLAISYLGPPGTFTHDAARSKFGDSVEYVPAATLEEVFQQVEHGRADYGVVPVENSTEGGIHETLTRFLTSPLKVSAEIVTEIHHALLARCTFEQITKVYSRPQAFTQTRRWLATNLPNVQQIDVSSTAAAAEIAAREEGAAAIAKREVAAAHGLQVLQDHIEDYAHNVTRFFVLGRHISAPTADDKTALLCSVKDKAGALHDLLIPFKTHGINMAKIESFPSPTTAWQYYFFIDFLGHPDNEGTRQAMQEMQQECVEFRILGAFPRWSG